MVLRYKTFTWILVVGHVHHLPKYTRCGHNKSARMVAFQVSFTMSGPSEASPNHHPPTRKSCRGHRVLWAILGWLQIQCLFGSPSKFIIFFHSIGTWAVQSCDMFASWLQIFFTQGCYLMKAFCNEWSLSHHDPNCYCYYFKKYLLNVRLLVGTCFW